MTPKQFEFWQESLQALYLLNGIPAFRQPGSTYMAPYIPGWAHGANSGADSADEAIAEYAGSWSNSPLRAEPFTPDMRIKWAVYFQITETDPQAGL